MPEKKAWIDFLEFRSKDGKVKKAGNRPHDDFECKSDLDVPERYRNDPRYSSLASEPPANTTFPKNRREAMAGLEAEKQGMLKAPIQRDPTGAGAEFKDANNVYWDVKSPPGKFFGVIKDGDPIIKEITLNNNNVILDCAWLKQEDLIALRVYLDQNLTTTQRSRVIEVNSNLY